MKRRGFVRALPGALLVASGALGVASASRAQSAKRIRLTARKFDFEPAEIQAVRGQPITLEVHATDFVHGFGMPDFGIRRDIVPGKAIEITLTPTRSGRFHYLCDNFCGDGHDRMSGLLIVRDG